MASLSYKIEYDAALVVKQKGNDAFKSGDYKNALKYYSQIIIYVGMHSQMHIRQVTTSVGGANPYKPSSRTTTQRNTDELRSVAFNNMAAVYLKMQDYQRAIEKCSHVLEADPRNKKALFRRGMAYRKLGKLDKARNDLVSAARAQNLQQVDPAIERELKLLKDDFAQTTNV
eukprot:UN07027